MLFLYPRYFFDGLNIIDNHSGKNLYLLDYLKPKKKQNLSKLAVRVFDKNPEFQIADIRDLLNLSANIKKGKPYFLRQATFEDFPPEILNSSTKNLIVYWIDNFHINGRNQKVYIRLPSEICEKFIEKYLDKIGGFLFSFLSNYKNENLLEKLSDFSFFKPDSDFKVILIKNDSELVITENLSNELIGIAYKGSLEKAYKIAENYKEEFLNEIHDYNKITIICGLGGKTGSGLVLPVANFVKESNKNFKLIIIKPFSFEGEKRISDYKIAKNTLKSLDFIEVNNDDIFKESDENTTLSEAFEKINKKVSDFI